MKVGPGARQYCSGFWRPPRSVHDVTPLDVISKEKNDR